MVRYCILWLVVSGIYVVRSLVLCGLLFFFCFSPAHSFFGNLPPLSVYFRIYHPRFVYFLHYIILFLSSFAPLWAFCSPAPRNIFKHSKKYAQIDNYSHMLLSAQNRPNQPKRRKQTESVVCAWCNEHAHSYAKPWRDVHGMPNKRNWFIIVINMWSAWIMIGVRQKYCRY